MNSDRSVLVHARPSSQPWVPTSSTGTVLRRRVFRFGGAESGRVTSIVRYQPHAQFPSHPHPQGEEIFVLEGVFSDWRGHHQKGTFLLNPEGFEHAPGSEQGCVLFVRLRQYAGEYRPQKAIDTDSMEWDREGRKEIIDDEFGDRQYLQRLRKGERKEMNVKEEGAEIFVVEGTVDIEEGKGEKRVMRKWDWVRLPDEYKGETILLKGGEEEESIVLVKENTLRSAFQPV